MAFDEGGRKPKKLKGPAGCFLLVLTPLLVFVLGGGVSINVRHIDPTLVYLFKIAGVLICIALVSGVVIGFVKIFKQSVGLHDEEDEI